MGLEGIADEYLSLLYQVAQRFAQTRRRRLLQLALQRRHLLVRVGNAPHFGSIAKSLHVALGYLGAALIASLLDGQEIR
jgi:hypothetical protein